jgi:DNA-binding transcriptional MerR regulator
MLRAARHRESDAAEDRARGPLRGPAAEGTTPGARGKAAPRPRRRATGAPLLRIGELGRRTGASRATIQHYLREGLLPAPVKTGRTMAYYDPRCVERILLIKELQSRYLPLRVIRRLLDAPAGRRGKAGSSLSALAAAGKRISAALEPPERPLARAEVPAQTGIDEATLGALEQLGIASAKGGVFGPAEVAVLRAVARLRATGVTDVAGFRVEDLALYRDAMAALLAKEVAIFGRSVVAGRPMRDVVRLGIAAATGATGVLVAIRNKLIADLVATELGRGEKEKRRAKRK